jgi:DNA-binding NarL/FixJ family response regulator
MERRCKKIEPTVDPTALRCEPMMPFQTLIVEDSADYRQLLHEALSARFPAMDVQEAKNGVDAAAHIKDRAPDLIFMDVNLPGENGLELTKKIKAQHPLIVVIVLTNYDLPEYREMAARCRANYFLSKSDTTRDGILDLVATLVPA